MRIASLVLLAGSALVTTSAHADAIVAQDELPVKRVTLYRSGVGSFERRGSVLDDASVPLRFRTEQINDILKSLVVLDLDGGTVTSVAYPSQEPLGRRLGAFGINLSDDPGMSEILRRVKGAPVRIRTSEGDVEGTVLNVENRATIYVPPQQGNATRHDLPWVNLLTQNGVRSVNLTGASGFEVLDAALAKDLREALAAIAAQRSDRYKTVDIALSGRGTRTIVAQYVHEAPVWKTSYRLVLPEDDANTPLLQGWAIVENTSDEDWKDVQLSLASGQPSAFRMNLYEPLFSPRQEVPVPVPVAVASRVYEDGVEAESRRIAGVTSDMARREYPAAKIATPGRPSASPAVETGQSITLNALSADDAGLAGGQVAAASAAQTGDVFFYNVSTPVTIARQRSSMLPIVSDRVEGRRVSIHTPGDGVHPRVGVEMTNSSGLELIAGPVAVYDGPTFAGDAQIGDTGKHDTRLLSYGMDNDVAIVSTQEMNLATTQIRIVQGVCHMSRVRRSGTVYAIENRDEGRGRTLIIEYPRYSGATLVEPAKAKEVTQSAYRFELSLNRKDSRIFRVMQENSEVETMGVLTMTEPVLASYTSAGTRISPAVRDAFARAQQLQTAVAESERRVSAIEARIKEITEDQTRIRQNLQTIDRTSDLASRLMKKLGEQETDLDNLNTRLRDERAAVATARDALASYVNTLSVE